MKNKIYTQDVINSELNLIPLHCYYCGSKEVTFLQYVGDAHCSTCGKWQTQN